MKTFRLYVGHVSSSEPPKATERLFKGVTKEAAERKAERFMRDGKFSCMAWELHEVRG